MGRNHHHDQGYRLGYAADAAVTHFNSTALGELLAYVRAYRRGEVAYRVRCDASYFARYFGGDADSEPPPPPAEAAACAARSLGWAVARLPRPGARRLALAMLRVLASFGARRLAGGAVELLGARLRCAWARVRFALAGRDAEARFHWFSQLWDATGDLARRRALARLAAAVPVPPRRAPGPVYAPAELSPPVLAGFHGREAHDGRPFRWSAPLAWLAIDVAPGDYEVVVDTGGLRRFGPRDPLHLYLDGRRAPALPDSGPADLPRFAVRRRMFRHPARPVVVLACRPLGTGRGPERRRLGAPVFALAFRPAGADPASSAPTADEASAGRRRPEAPGAHAAEGRRHP